MASKSIAVIGSLNVDFITRTPRLPEAGETLAVTSFTTGFGGKGANQAVACARLADPDMSVSMVGNVGDDTFGKDYFTALQNEGIETGSIRMLEGKSTGVANIIVEENTGENRILFAANANYEFAQVPGEEWDLVPEGVGVVVFQLEIPLDVVVWNVKKAREGGKHVIVNPAPAAVLPDEVYGNVDTLVLNETESVICSGRPMEGTSPEELCQFFLKKGVRDAVIITLGGDGLVYATVSGSTGRLPANKVKVVDTTAAGDTFVGGYAVQVAKTASQASFDHEAALKFASLAASKSVQVSGAMAAIPYLKDLQ